MIFKESKFLKSWFRWFYSLVLCLDVSLLISTVTLYWSLGGYIYWSLGGSVNVGHTWVLLIFSTLKYDDENFFLIYSLSTCEYYQNTYKFIKIFLIQSSIFLSIYLSLSKFLVFGPEPPSIIGLDVNIDVFSRLNIQFPFLQRFLYLFYLTFNSDDLCLSSQNKHICHNHVLVGAHASFRIGLISTNLAATIRPHRQWCCFRRKTNVTIEIFHTHAELLNHSNM